MRSVLRATGRGPDGLIALGLLVLVIGIKGCLSWTEPCQEVENPCENEGATHCREGWQDGVMVSKSLSECRPDAEGCLLWEKVQECVRCVEAEVDHCGDDCSNDLDDDDDGLVDCEDREDCTCETCDNGSDDDEDQDTDCEDSDCGRDPACPEICDNGGDDDGDGDVDCLDFYCLGDPVCVELCDNEDDDDGDSDVDCDDFDCASDPACTPAE